MTVPDLIQICEGVVRQVCDRSSGMLTFRQATSPAWYRFCLRSGTSDHEETVLLASAWDGSSVTQSLRGMRELLKIGLSKAMLGISRQTKESADVFMLEALRHDTLQNALLFLPPALQKLQQKLLNVDENLTIDDWEPCRFLRIGLSGPAGARRYVVLDQETEGLNCVWEMLTEQLRLQARKSSEYDSELTFRLLALAAALENG